MMEIIFFAFLTAYMIFRLWSVLGKRTGFDNPPSSQEEAQSTDNVIILPVRSSKPSLPEQPIEAISPAIQKGIGQIQAIDPHFNLDNFLAGAVAAFKMIVEAFATEDEKTLKTLLSSSVHKSFMSVLKDRKEVNQKVETTIVSLQDPEVTHIDVKNKRAQVTLKFVSEQIIVTKDAEENILDNPAHLPLVITDLWTFSRSLTAKDPNWVLMATRLEGN